MIGWDGICKLSVACVYRSARGTKNHTHFHIELTSAPLGPSQHKEKGLNVHRLTTYLLGEQG